MQLGKHLRWVADQITLKVINSQWSSQRKQWESECGNVTRLRQIYSLILALEDQAVNWKLIEAKWEVRAPKPKP